MRRVLLRAGLCVVWVGGAIECWGRGLQLQLYSTCSGKGGHVLVETGTFKIALILHIIHSCCIYSCFCRGSFLGDMFPYPSTHIGREIYLFICCLISNVSVGIHGCSNVSCGIDCMHSMDVWLFWVCHRSRNRGRVGVVFPSSWSITLRYLMASRFLEVLL